MVPPLLRWLGVCATAAAAALAFTGPAAAADKPPTPAQVDFFEKKVRPVLVERCYQCHAEKSEKIKGGLLLDTKEGWVKGGDTGPALVPGDPDKSLIIQAIRYNNPDIEMPPKGKMPAAEIEVLEQWVKMGAPDPRGGGAVKSTASKGIDLEAGRKHWAYLPLTKPAVPAVKDAGWPRGDIDRFILAKLEANRLTPAKDADKIALVRRIYFDLIGLPPTPAQIDAFVADKSPQAFEKLVDELLASPRFGERWGRHWLDVARFAESLTLRGFVLRDTWRYRDYVIDSFNHDRPFNLFMQEQVAGDLMTAASLDERRRQIAATAFLAMGNTNLEEQDKKQLVMDVVDEQVDTLGRAFLAQTIGCARCHDHKFDPISAKDYYALAGILKSTEALTHSNVSAWIETPLPMAPAMESTIKQHEAQVAALQTKLKDAKAALTKVAKAQPTTPAAGKAATVVALKDLPGLVVDDAQAKRIGEWTQSKHVASYIGDGYLHDDNKGKGEKTLTFQPELTKPGKYEVRLSYTTGPSRSTKTPVTVFSAEGEKTIEVNQQEPPIVDGRWVSLGTFTFEKNGQGFVIVSNEGTTGHVIADAVQFIPADKAAAGTTATSDAGKKPAGDAKETKAAARDAKDAVATTGPAKLADDVKQMEAELKKLQETGPKRDAITSIRESKQIGDTQVHVRGSVHTLGETAPRGFLQVVPVSETIAIPASQSGRLQLGQWLAHKDNPLPARVTANRVWHWLMGEGLCRTVDNFGLTGEAPSHPDLLDHLATQLAANNWSIKKLIRQVVLSRTYQLSSGSDEGTQGRSDEVKGSATRNSELGTRNSASSADPDNRLFSHMNRRRLDAECIRDAMLQVSGKLDLAPAGPTYKAGLSSDFGFKQGDYRRSVYSPVFRNVLPEFFEAFDFADPSVSTGKRNVSTVAPQALFLLNHPFVAEMATSAAAKLLSDGALKTDEARLVHAYRVTLGRAPSEGERKIAMKFLREAASGGKADAQAAWSRLFHAMIASMDFRYVE